MVGVQKFYFCISEVLLPNSVNTFARGLINKSRKITMIENIRISLKQNWIFLLLSALFLGWALAFIYHSSYVAIDGRRYFNLFDDAMISMRYAWNFAHGNGLVWNVGQRVEGYTNLLMTLMMSIATLLFEKRYAVLVIQLTGIFFMLGTAFFTLRIFETLKVSQLEHVTAEQKTFGVFPRYLLFIVILLYYPLNYWSLMGMETGLLAFLLSAGVLCSMLYSEKLEAKYLWLMSLCFGLAHLTRNESLLFAVLAFLYLTPTLKLGSKYVYHFLIAGGLYGLFVVGQLVFRYSYYGEFVPNTYTLKLVGMALDERLRNGWGFIQPFLKETGFVIAIVVAGMLFGFSRQKAYLFGFFLISVIYQIYVGGDSWNYWRIMAPTMPFLFVIFVLVCSESVNRIPVMPGLAGNVLLIALSCTGLYLTNSRFVREFLLLDLPYQNNYARAHVEIAIAINELTDEDATIGVFWAGTLPYYVDRVAMDFLGKSDKYIANLPPDTSGQSAGFEMDSMPGHNKHDLTYSIQTLLPTYVEEFDYGAEKLSGWAQDYYVRVKYNDAKLYLLKDSPNVNWNKVKTILRW
jgi:arabinofuranosyltransferase